MFRKNVPLDDYYHLKLLWSDFIKNEQSYDQKSGTVKNGV